MTLTECDENETYSNGRYSNLLISTKLGMLTLVKGKKWMIYILFATVPILISWVSQDYLFSNNDVETAFLDVYFTFFFLFAFPFGIMLITFPVLTDEISEKIIDLYIVRPIRRDVYWTSRWITVNAGVFIINTVIVTFYWIYLNLVGTGYNNIPDGFSNIFIDGKIYLKMLFLILLGTLTYSGLLLFTSSFNKHAFGLSMQVAIFDSIMSETLFLKGSEYIPRTHLNNITYYLFKGNQFEDLHTDFSMLFAYAYLIAFSLLFYFVGIWFFNRKEFP